MDLICQRTNFWPLSTGSELSVNGAHECYVLELPVKDAKPGSAIAPGKYLIVLASSPKFQAIAKEDMWFAAYADAMPHIVGIPGRSEIMLHPGNSPENTSGCLLVGETLEENFVGNSRVAFAALYPKIRGAIVAGEAVSIEVRGGIPLTGSNAGDVANAVHSEG